MPATLAEAQAAMTLAIRTAEGKDFVRDIKSDVTPAVILRHPLDRIEWDTTLLTATADSTPQFSVPETAPDIIMIYHHISILRLDNPVVGRWFISVSYPGLNDPIEVFRQSFSENTMVDLIGLDVTIDTSRVSRKGRPLTVWPTGSLIIQRTADILDTERVRCQYVRQVIDGPAAATLQTDLTGGFV